MLTLKNRDCAVLMVVGVGFMAAGIALQHLWQRVDLLSRHQKAMGDLTLTMAEVQHKLLDRQVREAWL